MKIYTSQQQGFTLIEVLVAMVILGIGLMSLVSLQATGIKGNSQASHITVASDWGADRMEKLFALKWTDIDLQDDTAPYDLAGLNETGATADGSDTSPDGFYTIYWNIADDTPMPDTKTIRVIILRSEGGVTKSVVMDYLKLKYI